jgi:hypothetical protein
VVDAGPFGLLSGGGFGALGFELEVGGMGGVVCGVSRGLVGMVVDAGVGGAFGIVGDGFTEAPGAEPLAGKVPGVEVEVGADPVDVAGGGLIVAPG